MNHGDIATTYLNKKLGYDINDIGRRAGDRVVGYGIPDLITSDGKEWEEKIIKNGVVIFTHYQLKYFKDDVIILIFCKYQDGYGIIDKIRFGDLLKRADWSNCSYTVIVDFGVDVKHVRLMYRLFERAIENNDYLMTAECHFEIKDYLLSCVVKR